MICGIAAGCSLYPPMVTHVLQSASGIIIRTAYFGFMVTTTHSRLDRGECFESHESKQIAGHRFCRAICVEHRLASTNTLNSTSTDHGPIKFAGFQE